MCIALERHRAYPALVRLVSRLHIDGSGDVVEKLAVAHLERFRPWANQPQSVSWVKRALLREASTECYGTVDWRNVGWEGMQMTRVPLARDRNPQDAGEWVSVARATT